MMEASGRDGGTGLLPSTVALVWREHSGASGSAPTALGLSIIQPIVQMLDALELTSTKVAESIRERPRLYFSKSWSV